MKKEKTREEYLRRVKLAIEYIEENLDKPVQLEEVARISCFSPYHFHRIFHALMHETLNDYISRKKMERAARRLVYKPENSITEIAYAGGYSSVANFSRAFNQYFGVSPSDIRNPESEANIESGKNGKLFRKYGKVFHPGRLYSQLVTKNNVFEANKLEELLMDFRIENLPERVIASISSPRGYELDSVYETWDKLLAWAKKNGIDEGYDNKFAICHDNPVITPEDKCRYEATVVVNEDTSIPSPFIRTTIPGGKYVIIHYKDKAEKISDFMTEVCTNWFIDSGYEPDDYPSIFNYQNDSRVDGYVEMDVYIKLKELKVS